MWPAFRSAVTLLDETKYGMFTLKANEIEDIKPLSRAFENKFAEKLRDLDLYDNRISSIAAFVVPETLSRLNLTKKSNTSTRIVNL